MGKRVLVLLSSYNGAKYIEEQLRSILEQETEHEVHVRVRDDGSRDGTRGIVRAVSEKYPGRVELLPEGAHLGGNGSFFALLEGAAGYDYYAFSDQDDVWLPDKVQTACDALEVGAEQEPLLYASVSWLVRDDLKPYGTTRGKRRPLSVYNTAIQNICPGHTQAFNNALLERLGNGIDASRVYVYDSWVSTTAALYGRILFDDRAHTLYRQHGGNQMGSRTGAVGKLLASARRARKGDGLRFREQLAYFVERNRAELARQGLLGELEAFLNSRSAGERLRYITRSRLYRQSALETAAFRAAVLAGRF